MQFHTTPRRNGVKMVYGKSDCRRENDTTTAPKKSNESSDGTHSHRHDRPTDMPMVVSFSAAFRGEYGEKYRQYVAWISCLLWDYCNDSGLCNFFYSEIIYRKAAVIV